MSLCLLALFMSLISGLIGWFLKQYFCESQKEEFVNMLHAKNIELDELQRFKRNYEHENMETSDLFVSDESKATSTDSINVLESDVPANTTQMADHSSLTSNDKDWQSEYQSLKTKNQELKKKAKKCRKKKKELTEELKIFKNSKSVKLVKEVPVKITKEVEIKEKIDYKKLRKLLSKLPTKRSRKLKRRSRKRGKPTLRRTK